MALKLLILHPGFANGEKAMLEHLALSENGFLFDARTGNTFTLSRTGAFLLRQLIDGTDRNALSINLMDKFDVDHETAERDVEQFVFRLKDLGLYNEGEE